MRKRGKKYTVADFGKAQDEINPTLYAEIARHVLRLASDKMVLEGETIKLPSHLGSVYVKKFKTKKNKFIDFKRTKEAGRNIYHRNKHSQGYVTKFYWEKMDSKVRYISNYNFIAVRPIKRRLAKQIFDHNKIHIYSE